jgi:hypothetical protein
MLLVPVLRNRNHFLRFRFRLLTSYGYGSGSATLQLVRKLFKWAHCSEVIIQHLWKLNIHKIYSPGQQIYMKCRSFKKRERLRHPPPPPSMFWGGWHWWSPKSTSIFNIYSRNNWPQIVDLLHFNTDIHILIFPSLHSLQTIVCN